MFVFAVTVGTTVSRGSSLTLHYAGFTPMLLYLLLNNFDSLNESRMGFESNLRLINIINVPNFYC